MYTNRLPTLVKTALEIRRRMRLSFILSKIDRSPGMRVIDIGCGVDGRSFEDYVPGDWRITGIDLLPTHSIRNHHPGFSYKEGDAQDLACFEDSSFDLAVSIGMLEHITDENVFTRVVSEIRRVAVQYIVVVPYRYAWIEPHYGVPFFPILPYSMQCSIVKRFNLSNHRNNLERDPDYITKNYRWLSNEQYRHYFPDSKIYLTPTLETIAIVRGSESRTKSVSKTKPVP